MSAGANISDEQLHLLRQIGFGLLLAAVFVPLDLLAIVVILGIGVYICLKFVRYQLNLASIRREG